MVVDISMIPEPNNKLLVGTMYEHSKELLLLSIFIYLKIKQTQEKLKIMTNNFLIVCIISACFLITIFISYQFLINHK